MANPEKIETLAFALFPAVLSVQLPIVKQVLNFAVLPW
jgi:hypothetical protein